MLELTLVLNASYEPLRVVPWQRAISLLWLDKAEVVESYDQRIHSPSFTMAIPAVIRFLHLVKRWRSRPKFSRHNIYARDNFACQYCGKRFPTDALTFDHVIPRVRGGKTSWDNIVTACIECNREKGGRTPREASMPLRKPPREPIFHSTLLLRHQQGVIPESWRDYLYWHGKLDE